MALCPQRILPKTTGLTMVELLVTTLIFAFIMAGFYAVLGVGNTTYSMDTNYLDLQQQGRNVLDRIVREVREASSVTITTVSASADTLTFSTPNETNIHYYRSGNNLVREYPSGTTKTLATNITYLKFTNSSKLLTISLKAEKTWFRLLSFPLIETVRLRN